MVLCTSIRHGSAKEFEFLFSKAKGTNDTALKNVLLSGLSCSKEQWQLAKYLNDQLVNSNSTLTALRNVATKSYGYLLAWSFIKNNWIELNSR